MSTALVGIAIVVEGDSMLDRSGVSHMTGSTQLIDQILNWAIIVDGRQSISFPLPQLGVTRLSFNEGLR